MTKSWKRYRTVSTFYYYKYVVGPLFSVPTNTVLRSSDP